MIQKTLLLDRTAWDLVLDAGGNIAAADAPYSIAQDVASAVKTFTGDCWYDNSVGIPYFDQVLGQFPALQFVQSLLQDEALTVPNVAKAQVVGLDIVNRKLTGQIQVIDTDGVESGVSF